MDASLFPLTAMDWVFVAVGLGVVYSACQRGLGRETLHSILFVLAMMGGIIFLQNQPKVETKEAAAHLLVNFSYYVVTVYVLMWAVLKFGAPLLLDGHSPGFRSRFWGGVLAMAKLVGTMLCLNLWFAMNSPDAHPLRLNPLPAVLRDAKLIQLSDATTDEIYRWLAGKGWLDYLKYTERPLTEEELKAQRTKELFGLEADSPTTVE